MLNIKLVEIWNYIYKTCFVVCPKKLFSDCRAAVVLGAFISDEVGPATLKYE